MRRALRFRDQWATRPESFSAKLARARNYFCYDVGTDAPRLLQALRQGAYRNAWHVMPAREPEGKESDQCPSKTRPLRVAVWRKSGIRASSRLSMSWPLPTLPSTTPMCQVASSLGQTA